MTAPESALEIARKAEELAAKATSAPWSCCPDPEDAKAEEGGETGTWHVHETLEDDPPIIYCQEWQQEDNARLIAFARTALPIIDAKLARLDKPQ